MPLTQDQIAINGHAIEARIYAEDPARDFLPSIGTLTHLRAPAETASVRIDTGVRQGDAITPYYDPMIAKLIVWGPDRTTAARRLESALAAYEVAGVSTNLGLLRAIAGHPAFVAADLDTGFIARHIAPTEAGEPDPETIAAAALAVLPAWSEPADPWDLPDSFRLNVEGGHAISLTHGDSLIAIHAAPLGGGEWRLRFADRTLTARAEPERIVVDGTARRARVIRRGDELTVIDARGNQTFGVIDPLRPRDAAGGGEDRVSAPIPARVTQVLAKPGDVVTKGTPLVVLEAMKMEITIVAPRDATIEAIRHAVGDMVEEGTELIHFAA